MTASSARTFAAISACVKVGTNSEPGVHLDAFSLDKRERVRDKGIDCAPGQVSSHVLALCVDQFLVGAELGLADACSGGALLLVAVQDQHLEALGQPLDVVWPLR